MATALPSYAELQCVSHYTFLHGSSAPEQLVQRAAGLGYHALAIADECTVAGVVKAHLAAKESGLKLLIGSQMGVDLSIVDKVAKASHGWGGRAELAERMQRCGLDPESDVAHKWAFLAEHMMSFPRHMSQRSVFSSFRTSSSLVWYRWKTQHGGPHDCPVGQG